MAQYTIGSIKNIKTENFYATIEEDYIITNRRITLMIYKKNVRFFEKSRVFGTYIKIPFRIIPNRKLQNKEWNEARDKLHNLAISKLEKLESEYRRNG